MKQSIHLAVKLLFVLVASPLGSGLLLAAPTTQPLDASIERAAPAAERATAHMLLDGKLVTTTTRVTPLVAAAGGVTCDARGMANWMSFMLNGGSSRDGFEGIRMKPCPRLPTSRTTSTISISSACRQNRLASVETTLIRTILD